MEVVKKNPKDAEVMIIYVLSQDLSVTTEALNINYRIKIRNPYTV